VTGEGRQTLAGAVLRVLAPLDGSGRVHGSYRTPRGDRRFPWRPDASRPCSMPLASWICPSELSPLEEPYPLSRALASLRVRVRPPPARRPRACAELSPSRRPFATTRPKARGTGGPGRRFPATVGRDRRAHRSASTAALPLVIAGLAGKRPARPLRSFALPGSPFSQRPPPWPGGGRRVGALLGFFPSKACSSQTPGSGVSQRRTRRGANPRAWCVSGNTAVSCRSRDPCSGPGL